MATRTAIQNIYIRFGRWAARSRNYATHEKLNGVSVYRAHLNDDGLAVLDESPSEQLDGQGRLVFAVAGQLAGEGPAGEPLLQRVKATRHAIDFASIPDRVKRFEAT